MTYINQVSVIGSGSSDTTVDVVPSSTAAATTNAGLVVALSPNSPLPAGTNSLGSVTANAGTGSFTVQQATAGNLNATAAQGAAAAITGAWPVKLTDGTNTFSLKPASTAAVATDISLVVGLSPNSPLPAGTNTIGSVGQSGTWTVQPGNTPNTVPWLATINQGGNSAAVTAANALKVDGSAVTQPISGTVTAVQATAANLNATVVGTVTSNQGTAAAVAGAWPAKITDGTNVAAVKPSGTAAQHSDPALVVIERPANTAVITSITASVTSVTALAANTNRLGATFVNNSASTAYLAFAATATNAAFTYRMGPNSTLELPRPTYNGVISIIWTTAVGALLCTEIT